METGEGDPVPIRGILIAALNTQAAHYIEIGAILVLLLFCAFMAGAESAFFSLRSEDLKKLEDSQSSAAKRVLSLSRQPELLLAGIQSATVLCSFGIAVLAAHLIAPYSGLGYFLTAGLLSLGLITLGHIIPKNYALKNPLRYACMMAQPVFFFSRLLYPFVMLMKNKSSVAGQKLAQKEADFSYEAIMEAMETGGSEEANKEESKILKGVMNFGNTYVKQIMTSRTHIMAHDIHTPFDELCKEINENRYSRLPVYDDSLDKIAGILYIKDLVPYLSEGPGFRWQGLIRQAYFVPETKKIDALLQEFRHKKVHMAMVVDEYGGTQGLVTLEDILEEIVGDIHDEFDDDEIYFSRLDNDNFVFEGKTALTDVVRVMELEEQVFEPVRGEAETIGGLMVEISGRVPRRGEKISYRNFSFTVESADKRRVRRVKVSKLNEPAMQVQE